MNQQLTTGTILGVAAALLFSAAPMSAATKLKDIIAKDKKDAYVLTGNQRVDAILEPGNYPGFLTYARSKHVEETVEFVHDMKSATAATLCQKYFAHEVLNLDEPLYQKVHGACANANPQISQGMSKFQEPKDKMIELVISNMMIEKYIASLRK